MLMLTGGMGSRSRAFIAGRRSTLATSPEPARRSKSASRCPARGSRGSWTAWPRPADCPKAIVLDIRPERRGLALDDWAYRNRVRLAALGPGLHDAQGIHLTPSGACPGRDDNKREKAGNIINPHSQAEQTVLGARSVRPTHQTVRISIRSGLFDCSRRWFRGTDRWAMNVGLG